jgi:DNA polymerase-3 subunit alpha
MTIQYYPNYCITHLHTAKGSVGDSIATNEDIVAKAKTLGMTSIAVTDHGSLGNMYGFYYECIDNGIKPIIGCEIYLCEDCTIKDAEHKKLYHLVLIAKNQIGIKNLLKIVSDASVEHYYYKPRIDLEHMKDYTEGLICTTACVGGYAPQLILEDKLEEAKSHLVILKEMFGNDLYLEIQPGKMQEQVTVNNAMINFSEELGIKLVATNDVHYINAEDWKTHDFHIRIQRKLKAPETEDESIYADKIYYMMSREELFNSFDPTLYDADTVNQALDNTIEISNKVEEYNFNADKLNLPEFKCPAGYNPKTYIEKLCLDRLDRIQYKIVNPSVYVSRMYEELEVIDNLGFSSYFLIMKDIVDYVKSQGYLVGYGRGSASGCLIAYLLGITRTDPIKYGLLFARFLSYERKGSVPDIDLDFESGEGRECAFNYTLETYGAEHCAAVSTFSIRKARSCIRSVCKLYDIDLKTEDTIAKLIPQSVYEESEDGTEKQTDLSIEESLEIVPELKEWQEIYPDVFEMAIKLEGLPCHTSIHAAGTLIVNSKVSDVAPMVRQESKELNATALDLHDAESQKLVKYDYLAINNLNIVRECQSLTSDVFDVEFDKYDDEKIWDVICSRNTTGLFQIGSNTYKQRMKRLRPRNIEQLADCLALVRGPCIQSGLDEDYMQIREGTKDIKLIHPIYDEITKDTNGIMIYQEQIMHLCAALGLSLYDGYVVVKAGAKKKKDVLAKYENDLWNLAKDKMNKETFDYMFKLVLDSAKYSFNKSHATSYALLTYVTAYYKTHHPKEFYAATLTCMYMNKSGKTEERKAKLKIIQKECMKAGIKFLPLDVNKSEYKCTIEDDSIRLGFCCLANVSENAYNEIKKLLPLDLGSTDTIEKIYTSVNKRQCNTKALNSIIAIGALGDNVVELYEKLYYLSAKKKNPDPPKYSIYINKDIKELELYDSAEAIEEVLCNANFINNSCSDLKELKRNNDFISGEAIITKVTKRKSKKGKQYAFVSLDTSEGSIEALLFNLDDYKKELKKNKKIVFKGKATDDDKIIINHIGA